MYYRVMGFAGGGGGNIAIAAAQRCYSQVVTLPSRLSLGVIPIIFSIVLQAVPLSMGINLLFYACQRLRFLDVQSNPGPRHPVPAVCRIHCSNVWVSV